MKHNLETANTLLREGVEAFAEVEANGIKVDEEYLSKASARMARKITKIERRLQKDPIWKAWKKEYGDRSNLGSRDQLGKVLFEIVGLDPKKEDAKTESGQWKTGGSAFDHLTDEPFVEMYLSLEKFRKMKGTFLAGIEREVCRGFLHPMFSLNIARTYRSSSEMINFQNLPIRDPWAGKLIRTCFIPRGKDRHIVEIDYGGIEVCIAACYNKDPRLIEYIKDPTKDMHRDMAAKCFISETDRVSKTMRYCGKNMFVFPQFYGSFYLDCAKNLWEAIGKMDLQTTDGTPIMDHLKDQGIKRLGRCNLKEGTRPGTFEHHVKGIEEWFWNEHFKVYDRWKKRRYRRYLREGGFQTKTGFYIDGIMRRNDVVNYPIQGSAFHCLLWSLIQIRKEIIRRKMRTKIIGQIHDSIVADVPTDELDDYLMLAQEIMTVRLLEEWSWIIVPLTIEAEVSPAGRSWHEKKEVPIPSN